MCRVIDNDVHRPKTFFGKVEKLRDRSWIREVRIYNGSFASSLDDSPLVSFSSLTPAYRVFDGEVILDLLRCCVENVANDQYSLVRQGLCDSSTDAGVRAGD